MSDKDKPEQLSDEDQKVWDEFAQEAVNEASSEDDFASLLNESEGGQIEVDGDILSEVEEIEVERELEVILPKRQSKELPQIDKRLREKLRKGQVPIEARLDLHGLNKTQSYEALNRFIASSRAQNMRCVLIVTGKGLSNKTSEDWLTPSKGVLKESVPLWLKEEPFKYIVLHFCTAQAKDGGTGALYLYLKKIVIS